MAKTAYCLKRECAVLIFNLKDGNFFVFCTNTLYRGHVGTWVMLTPRDPVLISK